MILIAVIGETGSGKTYLTKQLMSLYPQLCVFDVQNEYGLQPFHPVNNNKRFQLPNHIYDFKDFLVFAKKLKGYCFVIEEATGIFEGKIGEDFTKIILSKRHTQNRFIIIFHTLNSIPKKLYSFTDYLYLLKTEDLEMDIKKKYPNMLEDFKKLQIAPKYSKILYKKTGLAKDGKL